MPEPKPFEFNFHLKTNTKFGLGRALELGKELKELKYQRIGIIVDSGVSATEHFKKILENINKQGFERVKIWNYDLKAEPDYESLEKVRQEFLDQDFKPLVDCFVGIGGGSVMDFAKALATVTVNLGPVLKYRGFPSGLKPSLPMIAVPTTAGTGSEITYNASLINWPDKTKMGINTTYNYPVLAILDPVLTLSCPKWATVSSAMDALVHSTESFVCRTHHPLSQLFAREAVRLIFNNLSKVLDNPNDLKVRANLQMGAYLAAIAMNVAGGGPCCGFSYPLGVHFKVPHGFAGGVFLPYVVRHNVEKGCDYSELYDLIEGADGSLSREEKSHQFSEKLFELSQKVNLPSLKELGVNDQNLGILLKEVETLKDDFQQNPIPFSVEEGKNLLIKMMRRD